MGETRSGGPQTYAGQPTLADLDALQAAGTEARRRFQDWTSAGAIASIALSFDLVGADGINREVLAVGLGMLVTSVLIAALDRAAELELLLGGLKYARRVVLDGEDLPPRRRLILVRQIRYWTFYGHILLLLLGLTIVVIAAFTQVTPR